ncbi:MAG: alcohol dehydrogenase catalytic domain-containing protein [Nitrososphaerota archaeon]|jgi:D-arabinose 1-dehydrogenase-like Zn-dependent alcohol dehydrogenase|nr:alcohol dehydrogenase catalytic domain-containing protein [Nitrososphaerota archaeon]MDG6947228.1 alcohol dehydrogenase catalytic domain-containing protein [Nitrososphaerota archaeon]MDG6955339.1 alcohol dehydrogenase catalytic domain-containing protein [Nitrososphaerota archaeon]
MAVVEAGKPLMPMEIEVTEPGEGDRGVVLKMGGAGMCRTDLRLWRGKEPRPGYVLPFVLGHENAGVVYETGGGVEAFKRGDKVVVYAVWGDLTCRYCRQGYVMLCKNQKIPGQSYYYGGYAEYMYVPDSSFLVGAGDIDLAEAAPLADAGVTSYSAVKKALSKTEPGSLLILYGVGGLAGYAIQLVKALAPASKIVAVSRRKEKLEWAMELGADEGITPEKLRETVDRETHGEGAGAAVDFVGTAESTMNIEKILEGGGCIIEVGMEGENLVMPTFGTTVWEHELIGSNYGTIEELAAVTKMAADGKINSYIVKKRLSDVNEAIEGLDRGEVLGRYVLVP